MSRIQIYPGLKAKLWLIILINKKKNRVMLNVDGNENGIKINRSNQQKNKLHVQHTFFSYQQRKTNLHVQHAFLSFFAVVLHDYNAVYVRLKRQTSQLPIIFMEELSYVLTQCFVFLCSCSLLFFTGPHLHLIDGRSSLAASLSHFLTAALNFHVFLPTKFVSFVFSHSLQLFLCHPLECKHQI